jgi:hypothetical protein
VPRRPSLVATCTAVHGPRFDRDAHSGRCGVEIAFDRPKHSWSCSRDTAARENDRGIQDPVDARREATEVDTAYNAASIEK